MRLARVTSKEGEVYFINAKTGERVEVDSKYTTGDVSYTTISCPKCSELVKRGSFRTWQVLLSIFLFPIGLLVLLTGREPSKCKKCGYTWIA